MTGSQQPVVVDTSARAAAAGPDYARRRRVVMIAGVIILLAGGAAAWYWSSRVTLEDVRTLMEKSEWESARTKLTAYLDRHPDDAEARLLMAEALIKGDEESPAEAARRAIDHLRKIDDESPVAPRARLQEARVTLLILRKPWRAEQRLRAALELDADSLDANLLMWRLLDITGRHILADRYFWRVYEQSPVAERAARLRDWFLSEFYPDVANASFYRAFGATKVGKIPASINLLVRFRESEPDAPFLHAGLAEFYRESGKPKSSLELLREAPDLSQAMRDPFFVATLFETLVDLGELARAKSCFAEWPEPRSGYLYHRCRGILNQSVLNAPATAIVSYRKALSQPAGKFDWPLMMRAADCMRHANQTEQAKALRARFKHLTETVLTDTGTGRLRRQLEDLNDPRVAEAMGKFYREFELQREADAWEQHRARLLRATRRD